MPQAAPAATPSAPSAAVEESAADAALFGKYTAQHQAALATEDDDHAQTHQAPRPANASAPARSVAARAARPAGNQPARDASTGKFLPAAAGAGDAADDEAGDGARAADDEGAADDPHAGDPDPAAAGVLSEAEAVALLRAARASGDREGIDRALKALLPDSKGLSEFNVDGNRYAEFRLTVKREKDKLAERDTDLSTRERNVSTGLAQVEQLVSRYQPIEQLVQAAQGEDDEAVEAFVTLLQKLTKKPLNETVKRHLDRKLSKPSDPEVDALRRELKGERELREKRERDETEARQQAEQRGQIQRHLVFLDQELSKSTDARVVALVKSPAGMRAIFQAQRDHYDKKSGNTLTPEQAARFVLEQKQKELEPWQAVLGGGNAAPALPAPATTPNEPAAAPAARRAKPLGARGASASNGARKPLSDNELFEKYERLARLSAQ